MSGKRGSGATHIRYGHVTRPTEVLLLCPRCGGHAQATQDAWHAGKLSSGDCTPGFREPWAVVCLACPYRAKELAWDEMLAVGALALQVEVRGEVLWAWNTTHLTMLISVLDGGDPKDHPLGYFATYMHRAWLLKTRRGAYAKAARALLLAVSSARA